MQKITEHFHKTRLLGKLQGLPQEPSSLEEAYRIQKKFCDTSPKSISAWKLGGSTQLTRTLFKTKAVYYGPIVNASVFSYKDKINLDPKIETTKGELELSFRLSKNVENLNEKIITDETVQSFVTSMLPSVELPWSPYNLPQSGLKVLVADNCASGALVLGDEVPLEKEVKVPNSLAVSLKDEKTVLTEGNLEWVLGGPLEALKQFLLLAQKHSLDLKEGQLVATGGASPCVEVPKNKKLTVFFETFKSFSFSIDS